MYKVFFNEKPLTLSDTPALEAKNLKYINGHSFDVALDVLKNSSTKQVNIYHHNLSKLWNQFQQSFTCINAAGGIVKNKNGEFLFIFRLGKWDLPKGKVEKNESLEDTAIREVQEECGIKSLKIIQPILTTYHLYHQKEMILKLSHWFEMKSNDEEILIPQIEEGIEKVGWKSIDEIKNILPKAYKNINLLWNYYIKITQ